MVAAPFVVVLDANVLFPFMLRDTLLRAAAADFYQLRWSAQILDEMTRNLASTGTMTAEKATRLREKMEANFPEADTRGFESLVLAMKNDEKDRHVAAAAVKAGAQVIVTANLDDFQLLPEGLEAQSPDEFLCNVFDLDPEAFVVLLREQANDLRIRQSHSSGSSRASRGAFLTSSQWSDTTWRYRRPTLRSESEEKVRPDYPPSRSIPGRPPSAGPTENTTSDGQFAAPVRERRLPSSTIFRNCARGTGRV